MRGWSAVVVLSLAGCVQQESAGKILDPGGNVVLPPDNLQNPSFEAASPLYPSLEAASLQYPSREPSPLIGLATSVEQPVPPLRATSRITAVPALETSIPRVRQVTVGFEVFGAGAPSTAALEFVNPAGAPYDRQEVALVGSAFEPHLLEFVLPVAATAVDTGKMIGTWTARLLIDGKSVHNHNFELTP